MLLTFVLLGFKLEWEKSARFHIPSTIQEVVQLARLQEEVLQELTKKIQGFRLVVESKSLLQILVPVIIEQQICSSYYFAVKFCSKFSKVCDKDRVQRIMAVLQGQIE